MGSCCPADEYQPSDAENSSISSLKILFLGSGGCGKSTMFKQLRKLYGQGFTNKDRNDAVKTIATFVVETMQTLLEEEKCNYEEFEDEEAIAAAKSILEVKIGSGVVVILNGEIATNIKILWALPEIKALFDETAKLMLNGPCAHFFDSMDRISATNYNPTDKDILMQRRPTTGLIEENIAMAEYDDVRFKMVDVGGQKNERRKWIHHFENVSAVCYVISLSAYDEPLYEEEEKNSLQDAIALFRDTVNGDESHWFKRSSLFLIFNKKDVFEQKIVNKSLKECFGDDYDEDEYWNDCKDDNEKIEKNIEFIKQQFMDQINDKSKPVISFNTCAYEELDVQRVFPEILKNIVELNKSMGNINSN